LPKEFAMFKRILIAAAALFTAGVAAAQTPRVDAEVTKLDRSTNRVTLRHAEIKHLDMPAMTMVFRVRDPRWLEGLAVGDKIRFDAEKIDGYYTVTALAKR
jgi:Cu(I)/Ag(I) efflux system periplasmic protein CusF